MKKEIAKTQAVQVEQVIDALRLDYNAVFKAWQDAYRNGDVQLKKELQKELIIIREQGRSVKKCGF